MVLFNYMIEFYDPWFPPFLGFMSTYLGLQKRPISTNLEFKSMWVHNVGRLLNSKQEFEDSDSNGPRR
jgi:hypothetical protein